MGILIILLLLLLLVGGLPRWSHSRDWGYGPVGVIGLVLVVFVLLVLFTDVVHFSRLSI